jgi:tripartite-type tricarboxylate transporter receptor subunit TctC
LFRQTFGLDFQVTHFKSGGAAIQSVLGAHTPMSYQAIPPATALIRDGKVLGLAITASKRLAVFPDIPTLDELGIKGQEAETMQGLFAPAGTPKEIVALLQGEIAAMVKQPQFRDKLLALGVGPEGMPTDAFAKYCQGEIAKWTKVINDAKIPKI